MANIKITELPEANIMTSNDLLVMVDSGNPYVTKKITMDNFRNSVLNEAANLQFNRGTSSEVASYTPLEGEPVYATDTKILSIGDGATQGGLPINNTVYSINSDFNTIHNTSPYSFALDPNIYITLNPPGSVWSVETTLQFSNPDLEASSYNGAPVVDFTITDGVKYISAFATTKTIASGNIPININYQDLTENNSPITFTQYYVPYPDIATIYEAKGSYLLTVTSGNLAFGLQYKTISGDPDNVEDNYYALSGSLVAKRIL